MSIAYMNGEFTPLAEARVSPLDRGYLLADGIYEVIPVYAGLLFRMDEHLRRLESSLAAVRIDNPHTREQWEDLLRRLVERNGGGHQSIYLQVTRGVAPRDHAFPDTVQPSVFVMTRVMASDIEVRPASAVTRPDNRWSRCDVKTIALLPNVLLRQEAVDAGATEAILIRDDQITEGAATNVFVVRDDFIITPPKGPTLLPGITRDLVMELIAGVDLPGLEAQISTEALRTADEIWITSSSMEVTPVVEIDQRPVGTGQPGPVWKKVYGLFRDFKQRLMDGEPEETLPQ